MTATGVHNLDALIALFGRIDEVYCRSLRRAMARLDDTTTVLLGLENGMSATLYCSLVTAPAYRFAVYGTAGHVEIAGRDLEFRFTPTTARPAAGRHPAAPPEVVGHQGFDAIAAELEGFAAAIAGTRAYPITADEIRHGVAAFEAIVRSTELRRPVKVSR
jgi:predicted dehydrogenase